MSTFFKRMTLLMLLGWAAYAPGAVVAGDEPIDQQLTVADGRELWHRGTDQVLAGDFDAASATLLKLKAKAPEVRGLDDVIKFVDESKATELSRRRLRQRIHEVECKKAQELEGKKEWAETLGRLYRAVQTADDDAAFRKVEWVLRITSAAAKEGSRLRGEGKWRDAFILFETLRQTFPNNAAYKAEARDCRQHAHFEAFYTEKGEWKKELRNVEPSAVKEILSRVSQDYVREPDFKKLTVSALENLLLLAQTGKLSKIFPSLGDKDLVGNFIDRVQQQVGKVRNRRRFDYRDGWNAFEAVLRMNRETIDLPESVIVEEFIAGLLEPLDDFTSVIWPSEVSEFTKHTRGEFVGVGIHITKDPGNYVRVESPVEDTPAYEAGVEPGELIVSVDGKSTMDIDVNDAVEMITGEPGTRVTLVIRGLNGKDRSLTLTRRRVRVPTVMGARRQPEATQWDFMLDESRKIGYVRISNFMENTVDELRAALEQLQKRGCKGLILDLRLNPGGLLRAAKEVTELFLDEDEPIVMTKGRNDRQDSDLTARPGATFRGLPLIILVNEYSASASEIVSGALAGRGKAYVVGNRTYGKGLVQNLIPIADQTAFLKLTTQYYYIPTSDRESPWRCLHKEEGATTWGVDPDVEVKVTPYELQKIVKLRRKSDLLKGKGKQAVAAEVLDRKPAPTTQESEDEDYTKFDDNPDVDPQLQAALNIMRMKLLTRQPWVTGGKLARSNNGVTIEEVPATQ
ncbi:MAG: S41 family peptidase [Phycisphaerae bacterium]